MDPNFLHPKLSVLWLGYRQGNFSLWPRQRQRCHQSFLQHQTRFHLQGLFANIHISSILLFNLTSLSVFSCSLIQLMTVIFFEVLKLLLYPSHLLPGSSLISPVCAGAGTRLPISLNSAYSSGKSRFERYFHVF